MKEDLMKKITCILVVLLAVSLPLFASGETEPAGTEAAEEKNFVLKYSDTVAIDKPQCIFAKKLAEIVEEKTDGTVKIEVYPSGTLAGYSLEPVQAGIADMNQVTAGVASPLVKWIGVLDAPYLVQPGEHFHKVTDSRGEYVTKANEELAEHNLVLLGFYNYGTRDLTAKKPIRSLSDLKGHKMRVVPTVVFRRTWETFGASTTPMPSSEMVTAILTGVVDGQENSWHDIVGFSLWDVQDYIMETHHLATAAGVWMNKDKFDSLSERQQNALIDGMNEASRWFTYTYTVEKMEEYKDLVTSKGMTVIGPEEGLKIEEFQEKAKEVYDIFRDDWGEWIDKINSMK
jgi:tripartite ATP-independent transporter DctP family solute receptor